MPVNPSVWPMIHSERAKLADVLDGLSDDQWEQPSWCAGWTVRQAAAHVLAGAEQTGPKFLGSLAANAFRFNRMMDRDARRLGALDPDLIVERLRARTTTTNHPPAPVTAMLGEVVVHGADIRRPLGLDDTSSTDAVVTSLEMFTSASFPVNGKRHVEGVRLIADDADWTHGSGPEVSGTALSILLATTGRGQAVEQLSGTGVPVIQSRMPHPSNF